MLRSQRYLSKLVAHNPNLITVEQIQKASDDAVSRVALLSKIASSDNPSKQALITELIPNFSVFFLLKGPLEPEIAKRLVEINPERVHSNTDILARVESPTSELVRTILRRAVENEETDPQVLAFLVRTYAYSDEDLEPLVQKLIEKELELDDIIEKVLPTLALKFLDVDADSAFLQIFSRILTTDAGALTPANFTRALKASSAESTLTKAILQYIDKAGVDTDPNATELRAELLAVYGMDLSDMDGALKKYNLYQTKNKVDAEIMQMVLLKCFVYQSIKQGNETYLKVAESLLPPHPTIRSLQLQIIAQPNLEKALEVYNDYIQHVSNKVNENKRSQLGYLTEALMLSSLYDNDREFAQLLYEKAVQNKVVEDEHEAAHIKKLFRVYGDSFDGNDLWEIAREKLKEYVLVYVRGL